MTAVLTMFFALLAILALVGSGAAVVLARRPSLTVKSGHIVGAMAATTGTATLGSLYLSEVAGYIPCELCWVQRIFMYSLAVITTAAVLRRRTDVISHTVPLAVLGLATSIWHVIVQRLPAAGGTCDPNNPCSSVWVERFGFVTIPVMAGSGFLLVLALAWLHHRRGDKPATVDEHQPSEATADQTPAQLRGE